MKKSRGQMSECTKQQLKKAEIFKEIGPFFPLDPTRSARGASSNEGSSFSDIISSPDIATAVCTGIVNVRR